MGVPAIGHRRKQENCATQQENQKRDCGQDTKTLRQGSLHWSLELPGSK
jgi:hypothetical protein